MHVHLSLHEVHLRPHTHTQAHMEQSFIAIKPDGVQRGLIGEIISRFERRGYILQALKMITVSRVHAETHYSDLSAKPFFKDLVDFITSGPVVAMVWAGKDVVKTGRRIIGETNPLASLPGMCVCVCVGGCVCVCVCLCVCVRPSKRTPSVCVSRCNAFLQILIIH